MSEGTMTHEDVVLAAAARGFMNVDFQWRTALNTGRQFEVGYVYVAGERMLFVKRQPNSSLFYFCNQFREQT